MKKSIIATGAASLALAAMPVVGVFADSVTDTVQVTISSSCTVSATSGGGSGSTTGRSYSATLANGGTKTWAAGQTGDNGGGVMTVNCNNASGWEMTAVAASDTTSAYTDKTTMIPDAAGKTAIPTGTSGDASYWAFQVTGTGTDTAFNSFHVVPSTATKVAEAAGSSAGATINTGYQVHVSTTQQAGTYTGKVTYTISPKS